MGYVSVGESWRPESNAVELMPNVVSRIVEICVFKSKGDEPLYLVLKRSKSDSIYPGIWQIVTGSIHEGETAVNAALRELKEETAVVPIKFWSVPYVNTFYVAHQDTIHHTVFFAGEVSKETEVRLSDEHESSRWLALESAKSMLVWPGQKRGVELVHEYIVGRKEAAGLLELTTVTT